MYIRGPTQFEGSNGNASMTSSKVCNPDHSYMSAGPSGSARTAQKSCSNVCGLFPFQSNLYALLTHCNRSDLYKKLGDAQSPESRIMVITHGYPFRDKYMTMSKTRSVSPSIEDETMSLHWSMVCNAWLQGICSNSLMTIMPKRSPWRLCKLLYLQRDYFDTAKQYRRQAPSNAP